MRSGVFLAVLAVCVASSLFFLGASSVLTGVLSGAFVSATSLFFLSVAIKRFGAGCKEFSWGYFARSFLVRLVVAGGLLILFIGVLKVNAIGILAGLLVGLVINVIFLTRCKAQV